MEIFDAHTHINFRSKPEFEELAKRDYKTVVTCAFYPIVPRGPDTLLDLFELILKRYTGEISGLDIYAALGTHPRSIPKKDFESVLEELPEYLQKENVVALGEVGLEEGSDEEKEVLRKQLEIARDVKSPVVLHTPRENKDEMLKEILRILDEVKIDTNQVMIDHNDEKTTGGVLSKGFFAGLTTHPKKLDSNRAANIINNNIDHSDKIVLNSDMGYSTSNIFSLAEAIEDLEKQLDSETLNLVANQNAKRFFQV